MIHVGAVRSQLLTALRIYLLFLRASMIQWQCYCSTHSRFRARCRWWRWARWWRLDKSRDGATGESGATGLRTKSRGADERVTSFTTVIHIACRMVHFQTARFTTSGPRVRVRIRLENGVHAKLLALAHRRHRCGINNCWPPLLIASIK